MNLYKADGDNVPDLQIATTEAVPVRSIPYDELAKIYEEQGTAVADALFESLPGGTLDRLLAKLMERRASLFTVSLSRYGS